VSETATTASAGGSAPPPKREMTALRQIKESAQALLREGKTEETWELLLSALEAVLSKNCNLELLVAKLRRERLNPRSERLDPAQLALLFEALAGQAAREPEMDPRRRPRRTRSSTARSTTPRRASPTRRRRPIARRVRVGRHAG